MVIVAGHVGRIVEALTGDAPGNPIGGSAAQRAARAELARGEYHRDDPGPIQRALNWIGDRLGSLLSGGTGDHALLLLFVVLLVIGIVIVVRAGWPTRTGRDEGQARFDPLAPAASHDHRRLAGQFTAEGRRAEALREWLRAAVQTIEDRGVLPPRPGRTGAATARAAAPALPSAAEHLTAAMTAFDEVWFGGRAATDADVRTGRAAADTVLTARIVSGVPAPDGLAVPW
ncbi:MAG: DUF4129 domain-containing protein [Jatrophihabitans sp.]